MAMPGIFRHMMRSGWCFAISRFYDDDLRCSQKRHDNTALKFVLYAADFQGNLQIGKRRRDEKTSNLHSVNMQTSTPLRVVRAVPPARRFVAASDRNSRNKRRTKNGQFCARASARDAENDDDARDTFTADNNNDINNTNATTKRRSVVFGTAAAAMMAAFAEETSAYEDEKTVPAHQTQEMPPVVYKDYVDYDRGFTMRVPRDWQMDTPNGVLEREFHPRSEYGGRRCTVIVTPVGKVESGASGGALPKLRDLEKDEYKSAEKLGKTRANEFAPLDGATGGAKAATFLVNSEEKENGALYFYEWRSQAMLNFHFWEVAVLGPGSKGSGRKLGRRDVVSVKCQMPEDGMTKGDIEIFETITQSLKLLPLEENNVSDEF